jgi:hypothetical protein
MLLSKLWCVLGYSRTALSRGRSSPTTSSAEEKARAGTWQFEEGD